MTEQREIKLIAVDIDGTLYNNEHTISERNERALRAATQAGVQVVLATGKTRGAMESLLIKLDLHAPGIFSQGLLIYNPDGSIRHQQTLDTMIIRRVVTYAEDRGFVIMAYAGNRLLVKNSNPLTDRITQWGEPQPEAVGNLVNLLDDIPLQKLLIFGDDKRLKALRWQLERQLDGGASLVSGGVSGILEVLPPGASKGKALKTVLKELKINAENVLAIGDAENDVAMVKLAGVGVAVANADAKLKAVADYVVSSNDDDGVAEAIERFVKGVVLDEPASDDASAGDKDDDEGDSTPETAPADESESS